MGDSDSLDSPESETVKRLDQLIDAHIDVQATTRDLAAAVKELISRDTNQNNITVTHKTEGVGSWIMAAIGIAVTACVFTSFQLIMFSGEVRDKQKGMNDEIRDLKAWEQVHQAKISALEAKEKQK